MRRGLGDITFKTLIFTPFKAASICFARIAMVVSIQLANAVPTRSVGENLSPFPWLSVGASVSKKESDWIWVATVLRLPSYITLEVIVFFLPKFTFINKNHGVKRIVFFMFSLFSCFMLQAQDLETSSGKQDKMSKKQAKKEKINQMIRLEEEGEPSYLKHSIWGFKLNHDGYGGSFEIGKMKTPYRATLFQFEFNEKKHPKEEKQSTGDNLGGGFIVLGNPFVYGKQNIFYQFKAGIGQQFLIGGKGNKNGVGVYGIFAGGLALGMARPYYIEVESPPNSGQVKQIKYSQADSAEFLGNFIVGGTGLSKGWGEIKYVPGLHAKAALRFDWARFNNTISAIEFGFNFEYYTSDIVQMATIEGKKFFTNGYLSILFGKRK